jgi:phage antirepressor YoqD-like protein
MNDLIMIDKYHNRFVNARELHRLLGIGKDYDIWIKDISEQLSFVEGRECTTCNTEMDKNIEDKVNNQEKPNTDHLLTIEAAKMIIASRKITLKAKEILQLLIRADEEGRTQRHIEQRMKDQKIENYQHRIAELELKANTFDMLMAGPELYLIRDVANIIGIPGLGEGNFYKRLRNEEFLYKDNKPKYHYIEEGIFKVKLQYVKELNRYTPQLYVTNKGLAYFTWKWKDEIESVQKMQKRNSLGY